MTEVSNVPTAASVLKAWKNIGVNQADEAARQINAQHSAAAKKAWINVRAKRSRSGLAEVNRPVKRLNLGFLLAVALSASFYAVVAYSIIK